MPTIIDLELPFPAVLYDLCYTFFASKPFCFSLDLSLVKSMAEWFWDTPSLKPKHLLSPVYLAEIFCLGFTLFSTIKHQVGKEKEPLSVGRGFCLFVCVLAGNGN